MSSSSTPSSSYSDWTKHRRAYVACMTCRQRKIKCVPTSENDWSKPCTRCAKKGLQCEYAPAARLESSTPQDPAPSSQSGNPSRSSSGHWPSAPAPPGPPGGSSTYPRGANYAAPQPGSNRPYSGGGSQTYPYAPGSYSQIPHSYASPHIPGASTPINYPTPPNPPSSRGVDPGQWGTYQSPGPAAPYNANYPHAYAPQQNGYQRPWV
ncbi:hypothetical protein B0H11DRAFT_2317970 [Mycena galericulata]|nr:hypothetical protein B0H11DRAFT_2326539 [Mycena galericulata]KAJ7458329.1 hypothetical protein B0H11DRAFT_2317970 [Mycena galericulata]